MSKKEKLLQKTKTNLKNIRFDEFITLLEQNGFTIERSKGSHFFAYHKKTKEGMPIQELSGKAKPYQIAQFLDILRIAEKMDEEM